VAIGPEPESGGQRAVALPASVPPASASTRTPDSIGASGLDQRNDGTVPTPTARDCAAMCWPVAVVDDTTTLLVDAGQQLRMRLPATLIASIREAQEHGQPTVADPIDPTGYCRPASITSRTRWAGS
jgi:hypothetical protein